jgi:hypothetical protein
MRRNKWFHKVSNYIVEKPKILVASLLNFCYNKSMKKRIFHILIIFSLVSIASLQSNDLLDDIIKKVSETKKSGELPIVIFDLDGTLFYTGYRTKQIFLEFAREKGDSELVKKVESMDVYKMKYRVRESLKEAGIEDSILQKEILDAWRLKFFKSDYLKYDKPIPGSVEFVNELSDSCVLIIYLTGRDAPGTLIGTVSSLQNSGFPMGTIRTELIMKKEPYAKSTPFKKKSLLYIEKLGTVVAAFENEPANINLFYETFPDAISVFLETSHKPNAPPVKEAIHRIDNYLNAKQ